MKVVSKGFEGAMMPRKKIDRSKISVFDAKTGENWEILVQCGSAIVDAFFTNCDRAT